MRHGEDGAAVEEDFDDFVVVPVRRQHQRSDVGREGGRVGGDRLPTLEGKERRIDRTLLCSVHISVLLVNVGPGKIRNLSEMC